MKIVEFLTDEDAVSPVIGVILMVAITVILAAVIGTFVLGLGDQVSNSAPQVTWGFSGDSSNGVDVTHEGGDSVDAANLDYAGASTIDPYGGSGTITAGDTDNIASGDVSSGTLRIVWDNPDSDKTNVIGSFDVP